jgi:hypothetical protein
MHSLKFLRGLVVSTPNAPRKNLMNPFLRTLLVIAFLSPAEVRAFDEFSLQIIKTQHEESSWNHDIYTGRRSTELLPSSSWFQKPALTVRFNATHQEYDWIDGEIDHRSPMASLSFQTIGGVQIGVSYAYGCIEEDIPQFYGPFQGEHESRSVGGYVAKQWDCGLKVGATWSHTRGDLGLENFGDPYYKFDTLSASAMLGFARSFGEKKFGRNVFVDTSANFLFEFEDEPWHFIGMVKVGHNLCPEFALYGIFNVIRELEERSSNVVPSEYMGYHPIRNFPPIGSVTTDPSSADQTWGEAGGGFQVQLGRGFSLSAEATTPIMDDNDTRNVFQVRSALNWSF